MNNVHLWVLQVFLWFISSFFSLFILAHFFLALKNIPLFRCIAVYLSIHLVKNILVVSKFQWWELKLIQKSMHVLFVDIVFLFVCLSKKQHITVRKCWVLELFFCHAGRNNYLYYYNWPLIMLKNHSLVPQFLQRISILPTNSVSKVQELDKHGCF